MPICKHPLAHALFLSLSLFCFLLFVLLYFSFSLLFSLCFVAVFPLLLNKYADCRMSAKADLGLFQWNFGIDTKLTRIKLACADCGFRAEHLTATAAEAAVWTDGMCLFLSCAILPSECLVAGAQKAREEQHAQPRSLLSFQRAAAPTHHVLGNRK
ncbi:hypothetical protein GQ54DRAFT_87218 [Martensiomyces pterosporus]|nr:hypothetical protein GQ54DRAFT_87218 [Martensiomyces pterosporus]